MTVSLISVGIIAGFAVQFLGLEEELEESTTFYDYFFNFMTKGGLLVLVVFEMKFIDEFAVPNHFLLLIFDLYLGGWYCFMQYMCKKATQSYSYAFLNDYTPENLGFLALVGIGSSSAVKYLIISLNKDAVDEYKDRKGKEEAKRLKEKEIKIKKHD